MPRRKKDPDQTQREIVPSPTPAEHADLSILPIPSITKTAIERARVLAQKTVDTVLALAHDLTITDQMGYVAADEILHQIKVAQKYVEEPFDEVIKPIRGPLDRIYAIKRTISNPLLDIEVVVKEKMRQYQITERKRIDDEQKARLGEARLIAAMNPPPSPPFTLLPAPGIQVPAGLFDSFQRVTPDSTVITVAIPSVPPPQPPRAASSTARTIKRWRVTDFELLLEGFKLGMVPAEMFQINPDAAQTALNNGVIDTYPGVESYDDVQIIGR